MLRSLYSGMAGLKAHQTKMDVIGNNISNVNTYGYKTARVSFRDVFYQNLTNAMAAEGANAGANAAQIGYGAMVASIDKNMARAGFASTGYAMDCYINGEGFFIVRSGNEELYTRVGMLGFDGNGNLTDGNNNMVLGFNVDYVYNSVALNNGTIHFGEGNGELLSGYSVKLVYRDAAPGGGVEVEADAESKTVAIYFTPDSDTGAKGITAAELQTALQGTWNWVRGTAPAGFDTALITVEEAAANPDTVVNASYALVSSLAAFDYTRPPGQISNDFGALVNVGIDGGGTITGQTADGRVVVLGRVALANITNPQGLEAVGESMFRATPNSGTVSYHVPGQDNMGTLKTGGLEMSSVDLTNEFSEMITTQRGFQAASKIITVSDEMLEILVNLKR